MATDIDPLDALAESTRRYRETERAHEKSRDAVVECIVTALKAGKRPTDVAARSPFTDAYVRRLARENGIQAQPRRRG
ncbi:hypothetical protein Nocox_02925 [Nonomuraea coxensis DSM 45129]|uniref:Uncharacterized protein n=1 Tax=Nonomuraea coxensis DSM 45129 TaxID=1122611 RepID=A0ABX8TRW9_9ACTN|nr:hypothetical protein [Nonomuraea coxensis]QYC38215.1 hypothetical protein Nocox_02925 [Nonomuraea coxensis DSM 45129]